MDRRGGHRAISRGPSRPAGAGPVFGHLLLAPVHTAAGVVALLFGIFAIVYGVSHIVTGIRLHRTRWGLDSALHDAPEPRHA